MIQSEGEKLMVPQKKQREMKAGTKTLRQSMMTRESWKGQGKIEGLAALYLGRVHSHKSGGMPCI